MKILNYGSVNIDHVYQVPHIVLPGETISGGDVRDYAGGKGANQSVALARAGAAVWHAGKIGGDGLWLRGLLEECGVRTEYVRTDAGPTGHTVIQVTPEGQNSILLYAGGNAKNTSAEIDETLARFTAGDYLVLQNEINLVPLIMEKAHVLGLKICLNPAPYTGDIAAWPLQWLELLIVNEIEGQSLSGVAGTYEAILDALVSNYPDTAILMTLGKAGSLYGRNTERHFMPIVDAPVVDTTAAGDTFLGYFLHSRISGKPVLESMEVATYAAALTVSRTGAMNSIPDAAEVERFMKERKTPLSFASSL